MSFCPPGVHCCIRLLGPPTISTRAGSISAAKPFVFGAALYIGLHRGHAVRRAELSALLWPDADGATRSERLRWLMRQLRHAGFPTPTRTPEIELAAEEVLLDVDELEGATSVTQVLAQFSGDLLAGYEPSISDTFSHWLEGTRDALRSRVMRVLSRWLAEARRSAEWSVVEELARRMIALDELHEQASLALVEALVMQGRHDRAAQVLARYGAEVGLGAATVAVRMIQEQVNELVATEEPTARRSPFVGRGEVIARLLETIDPRQRLGRRIGLGGPPGIGKSRTLEEFALAARLRGTRVARLGCSRADALRPLSLVADLARGLLAMRGALGASPESIEVLRRFLGEREGDADGVPHDLRRAAVYAALSDLIEALVDDRAVAVVADDVQWAEPGSWAILGPLMADHPSVVWIFGLRCESSEAAAQSVRRMFGADQGWEHEGDVLWLAPLANAEIAALCTARAAPRPIPVEVLDLLIERAAGIPFVAEALVEHWCEMGELVSLPPSVTRFVSARLDRLSPVATRVLETVAVLGADAEPPAVEAVSLLDRAALLDATRELDSVGIMRTAGGTLSAHALWTEAVLARVPRSTLQLQHRYAAEWLEQVSVLSSVPDYRRHWAVASHWLDASDPERARRALDSTAKVLLANGFVVQAAAMLERAGGIAGISEAALHYWQRAAELYLLDQSPEVVPAVQRIHDRYDAVARVLRQERYTSHHEVEQLLLLTGNLEHASHEQIVRRLTVCVLASEASTMHRLLAAHRLLLRYTVSEMDRAVGEQIWHAVGALRPATARERLVFESCASGYYSRVAGEPSRGLAHALRARQTVTEDGSLTALELTRMLKLVADAYELDGDLDRAQATRHELLERGQKIKSSTLVNDSLNGLIGTALEAGRPWEARPLLPLFGRRRGQTETYMDRSRSICWVVCALEEGDAALARQELDVPLSAADEGAGAMPRARVLAIYAHLALLEDDEETTRALLPRLLACFTGRLAYMDHPAYVAGLCLERLEDAEAAADFVNGFLRDCRLERWTPREELLRLASGRGSVRRGSAPLTNAAPALPTII